MISRHWFIHTFLIALCLAPASCRREEKFPAIGDAVVSPVDVAVSDSGSHFYVLNADFDRTYNSGSLLVLDAEGQKVTSTEIPRMGRSITVAGSDLLVTTDFPDDDQLPQVFLFDITDPAAPALKASWEIHCSPFNAVMRKGYAYFAVSCLDGSLIVGTLAADRAASTLKWVRRYGISRRALHIDPLRGLIFGFTTDPSKQTWTDREAADIGTWDPQANEVRNADGTGIPNEIPDDMENSKRALSGKGSRQVHQFFMYDIEAEKAAAPGCSVTDEETCSFPYRENSDPVVEKELRWLYFKLANFDGTPDASANFNNAEYRYYRTNFWDAKPDPDDPDVFYLSHRGPPGKSPHANQIVKVTVAGNLRAREGGAVPLTGDVLNFERVYGFKGAEVSKYHYPGDFEIVPVAGQKVLVVNHFRDLVNWTRGDVFFALDAKILGENTWVTQVEGELSQNDAVTYYQVAVSPAGRILAGSFYGNAVMLLEVIPGVGIRELSRIE